jgi:Protein of unknown function (DUF3800)
MNALTGRADEKIGQIRPIENLHFLVSPSWDALMATLKVYSDDSGDENDPQHSFVAVAGYVSTVEKWPRFELEWNEILVGYEVPYLHMREWVNKDSKIYKHLKDDDERQASFFGDLAQCVKDNTVFSVNSVVKLADLREFNIESGLQLDAYAFGLYGCIVELREKCPDDEIEIIIDKIDKRYKRAGLADQYARTDTFADLKPDLLPIMPLAKSDSFKTVLPIQAADFLAWELRKVSEDRKGWIPSEESRASRDGVNADYWQWAAQYEREHGKKPRQRKSGYALQDARPPKGYIWDLYNIRAAHTIRHKNGWQAKDDER